MPAPTDPSVKRPATQHQCGRPWLTGRAMNPQQGLASQADRNEWVSHQFAANPRWAWRVNFNHVKEAQADAGRPCGLPTCPPALVNGGLNRNYDLSAGAYRHCGPWHRDGGEAMRRSEQCQSAKRPTPRSGSWRRPRSMGFHGVEKQQHRQHVVDQRLYVLPPLERFRCVNADQVGMQSESGKSEKELGTGLRTTSAASVRTLG
jgi:hypothetical protein